MRWWANPNRNCNNDVRFTNLPKGRSAQKEIAELIYLCWTCPVLEECALDTEKANAGKYPTRGVVRAGTHYPDPGQSPEQSRRPKREKNGNNRVA